MVSPKRKNNKQKTFAEESEKTRKTREKLKKYLAKQETAFSEKALEQKSLEIQKWISRHSDHRIPLKDKSIALFDENQNAAAISEKVAKLAIRIQKGEHTE